MSQSAADKAGLYLAFSIGTSVLIAAGCLLIYVLNQVPQ